MLSFALFAASTAHAGPVTIHVNDPAVVALEFDCDGDTKRAAVKNGVATLPDAPAHCVVYFVKHVGDFKGPGTYSCSAAGCTLDEVEHKPIADAPARVNIILTSKVDAQFLELNCPSGHRDRQAIEVNTAVFDGVPVGQDCTLMFKGGVPAQYRPIRPGTFYCSVQDTVAVCTKR